MKDLAEEIEKMSCPVEGQDQIQPLFDGVDVSSMDEFREDGAAMEKESVATPLFGPAYSPSYLLQHEQPTHRLMCVMLSQGYSIAEIAQELQVSTRAVQNLKCQPWAVKYVGELIEKAGAKTLQAQLAAGIPKAVDILMKSVDEANSLGLKPEHRIKAGHDFLSRLYGNAPQVHKHIEGDGSDCTTEELLAIARGRV